MSDHVGRRPVVAIVFRYIHHYRQEFFETLRRLLAEQGVTLRLLYGDPGPEDVGKKDAVELPWAERIKNRVFTVHGISFYWQECLGSLRGVDLVIVEQATRLLVNYPLLGLQTMGCARVALWGHGITVKSEVPPRFGYPLKAWMSRRPHWWFTYTRGSADVVRRFGYPLERITVVQNAIDTKALSAERQRLEEAGDGGSERADSARPDCPAVEDVRARLGLEGRHVCLYVGGMYRLKRLDYLIDACDKTRELVPDFELIVMGDGPDAWTMVEACARRPWMHYVGPVLGIERVPYFMASRLILMPGLVGLAVLDGFALGLPLVTTALSYHSPEIAYLAPGRTGLILPRETRAGEYAEAVASLLRDESRMESMRDDCLAAAQELTVENMARRFADGVMAALRAPRA